MGLGGGVGQLDDDTDANLSKSGASVSRRVGRRLRVNSRPFSDYGRPDDERDHDSTG